MNGLDWFKYLPGEIKWHGRLQGAQGHPSGPDMYPNESL